MVALKSMDSRNAKEVRRAAEKLRKFGISIKLVLRHDAKLTPRRRASKSASEMLASSLSEGLWIVEDLV